jgi:hypothetical protein
MTTTNQNEVTPGSKETERETVELHVKRVPRAIWLKARQQALAQKLSFRDYVIRVLETAGLEQPVPGGTDNLKECVRARVVG